MTVDTDPGNKRKVVHYRHDDPMHPQRPTGSYEVGVEDENGPDTLTDGTKLLTLAELIKRNFENAGCPTKGSEPPDNFFPD